MHQKIRPTMSIIVSMIFRALIAAAVTAVAVVLALLNGFFSGGGRNGLVLASTVAMFSAFWVLLPAVRASMIVTLSAVAAWTYLAFRLADFGYPGVKGWMLNSWKYATLAIAGCLLYKPPVYLGGLITWLRGVGRKRDGRDA